MLAEPIETVGWSTWKRLRALWREARSERRLESLDCLRSSAGLRMRVMAVARMAMIPMIMRSSIRVKEVLDDGDLPRTKMLCIFRNEVMMKSSINVKEALSLRDLACLLACLLAWLVGWLVG